MNLPLDAWPALRDLGSDPTVEVPATGTMNDTWIVRPRHTRSRPGYVLRRHRFRDRARIWAEHRVMSHARSAGIPVPPVLPDHDGDALVRHDDRWWTLYGFAAGGQVARDELTTNHARAMGEELGRVHVALAGLSSGIEEGRPASDGPTATMILDEIAALRSIIDGLHHRRVEDDWADEELAGQAGSGSNGTACRSSKPYRPRRCRRCTVTTRSRTCSSPTATTSPCPG